MGDELQEAINALRAAGKESEARAVETLRATHAATMNAYHAGQRASYDNGVAAERERCAKAAEDYLTRGRSPLGRAVADAIRKS